MNAGKTGLEVRDKKWQSFWVCRTLSCLYWYWTRAQYKSLLYHLDTIGRDEANKEEKENIRRSGSCLGKNSYTQFPGLAINANENAPPHSTDSQPEKWLFPGTISQTWAKRTGSFDKLKVHDKQDGMHIFNFPTEDFKLDAEAKAYLADDEEEPEKEGGAKEAEDVV